MKFNQNRDYAPLKDPLKLQIDDSVIKNSENSLWKVFNSEDVDIFFHNTWYIIFLSLDFQKNLRIHSRNLQNENIQTLCDKRLLRYSNIMHTQFEISCRCHI